MAREYFCAYHSLIESLEPFSDVEKGRLFSAALVYSRDGAEPQLTGNERFIWPTIKAMIDRDRTAYAAKCEKNKANVSERYRSNTTVYERSQEKEKEKEEDKDKEKLSSPNGEGEKRARERFTPPTLEEVRTYARQRNSSVDADKFYEYFTAGEWKDSKGNPVRNWKQKLLTWEKFDAPKQVEDDPYAKYEKLYPNDPFCGR